MIIRREGKRCGTYRGLFARRFPKRALSSSRRAVHGRVTTMRPPLISGGIDGAVEFRLGAPASGNCS